jgi:hypothetical protein
MRVQPALARITLSENGSGLWGCVAYSQFEHTKDEG